jgi:hypothetical protein
MGKRKKKRQLKGSVDVVALDAYEFPILLG